jgi:hypothetical protein
MTTDIIRLPFFDNLSLHHQVRARKELNKHNLRYKGWTPGRHERLGRLEDGLTLELDNTDKAIIEICAHFAASRKVEDKVYGQLAPNETFEWIDTEKAELQRLAA